MDPSELVNWIGLRLIPGVGAVTFHRLVKALGSPGQVLGADRRRLQALSGVSAKVASAVSGRNWQRDPEAELERLDKLGAKVVTIDHEEYPPLLKEVVHPPPILFVRGDLTGCHRGGVAVVGSRKFSPYGRRKAEELGRALGQSGVSTISGLARGVDTAAHTGALEAGGHTVGVMGCGLNVAYPPENVELMQRMAQEGAVVSEFPLDTPPAAGNFPGRNRVISGLSRAVVVLEASVRSGALITSRHALDQGREVLAMPGPVDSPTSGGCHSLIESGARLYRTPADVLGEGALPPLMAEDLAPKQPPPDLPEEAAKLLELIGPEPIQIDVLVRQSGMLPQEVSAFLMTLEMAGLVSQQPGGLFIRE